MVVDEIVTSLKNAVDHGESIESAVSMLINSGYNPSDVNEAAQLVGGSAISYLKPKPTEELSTPAQKKLISGKPVMAPQVIQPVQRPPVGQNIPQRPIQQPQLRQGMPYQVQNPTQQVIGQGVATGQIQQAQQFQQAPVSNPALNSNLPLQQPIPLSVQPVQQINDQKDAIRQDSSAIKQNISSGAVYSSNSREGSLSNELSKLGPRKESYIKEIILLIVLLLLIGVLIGTFVLKDQILSFLSGV